MDTWFKRAGLLIIPMLLAISIAAQAATVMVRKGTDVPLVFDRALSSKTARVGDRVPMHVASDVIVNGSTVIRSGTKVTGIISKVEKRKRYGVSAKMQITLNPVRFSNVSIPLEPKSKGKYTGSRTDQAAYATGGGALLLGPVGLLGGYFVVGKPVNVRVGEKLISEVSSDTAVNVH